ncbi:MAG: aminoglycoside 6-adenylyltransferase [Anaerolineae bacterium]|nr:aminoglycoside 6-adenylyltransferase [Anaerolineae bacterium]
MRSEQEMLDLILETARQDARIRAVVMNGSRVNPDAPKDFFQDFDIVYIVHDVAPFWKNLEWVKRFGELMIMQMPEDMKYLPPDGDGHFTYLMQFADGNRIDLSFDTPAMFESLKDDSLSVLLLDKDGIVGEFPPPDDRSYRPEPPTAKVFAGCCNEFWWVSPYVAKALWREELPYVKHFQECVVREPLMTMLGWYVGVRTGFAKSPGKCGKYLDRYLDPELWDLLVRTYSDADPDRTWEALFAMAELFRKIALEVAAHFGFDYPHEDDARVMAHLHHVRALPRDAKEMY